MPLWAGGWFGCLLCDSIYLTKSPTHDPFTFRDHLFRACPLYSACYSYAVRVYRMLGETTRGKGGSPAAIPLPLPGFLPQSPAFLLPHPPMDGDVKLHVFMMLHRT